MRISDWSSDVCSSDLIVDTLPFAKVQKLLHDADIVVCHGGTGSLITALRAGCRVIAMPRLSERGEHYDNHQSEITEAFVARGLIWSAATTEELKAALTAARAAKIGRAHVCTPVTNAQIVCRLLIENNTKS